MIPMQIIYSKGLSDAENMWLTGLAKNINTARMENILESYRKLRDKIQLEAYVRVVTEANPNILREVLDMSKTKTTLQQVLVDTGVVDLAKKQAEMKKGFEVAESMLTDGESLEKISKHTKIPVEELIKHFKL